MKGRVIEVDLSASGIKTLQRELDDYQKWIERKTKELAKRLAQMGVEKASVNFGSALYDGINDASVTVEQKGASEYVVKANGASVLFIELGTGIHYPDAPLGEYQGAEGMTHGSYGKGLGNNDYWWYTGQPGNAGGALAADPITGYVHPNSTITHGNPPNMPMYNAVKELEQEFAKVVMEVFAE